jgi:hypothetical protein
MMKLYITDITKIYFGEYNDAKFIYNNGESAALG